MTGSRLLWAALPGLLIAGGCAHLPRQQLADMHGRDMVVARDTRSIPVVLYGDQEGKRRRLAIVAAGYGLDAKNYTFISRELATRGYVVAALPSHLPGDPPIPSGPDVASLRRPFWENGVADIRYVVSTLRARGIAASEPFVLVGHSHGGDISMLLAQRHPGEVKSVFSLDNRRVAIPRTDRPRICSVRSSDQVADLGVLPDPEEQKRHRMLIVHPADLRHDDMWDGAAAGHKAAIISALVDCLGHSR